YFENHENFYTSRHYELISILRNILTNSIEAMNEGKIELIHTKNNSSHIFVIKDSGKGIKEKDIKNIFKAGFSTKINYNTGDISRGLGLNLVKKLIEKDFNGKISVFSLENIGTTFTIAIPIKDLEEG
ncbi:MAG: sensor histidine kinase, partial [Senegalia sp. (in: firmicutes)]|uniref:sensor histidine kinase n=1 Tax=Senegalia sp. (in: firmicutes) TaxID=1924098 RepID=UPI003F966612